MTREEKVLHCVNKSGYGVEIRPSFRPIASRRAGYNVHIIDHMPKNQLIDKYKEGNLPIENIEDVDYVWDGRSYVALTGKPKFYDWIIASHVIEHTPDLIGFLNDCDSILKDDGVLSLVIPDARYCFDCFRPITGLSEIVDSHFLENKIHTPGTVVETRLNSVTRAGQFVWDAQSSGEYVLYYSLERARNDMDDVLKNKAYIDLHAWCFTPHSFRLLIHDLYYLRLAPFQEISFFPTEGSEFYIPLGRKAEDIQLYRLQMLKTIKFELLFGSNEGICFLQAKGLEIEGLELQIRQMEHSIAMQLASRYQRVVEKLLRSGTRRRDYYELGLSGIRTIINEGWRSFFRKAIH